MSVTERIIPAFSAKKIALLSKDYTLSAKAVALTYVHDTDPGILRLKKGKGFAYFYQGSKVSDKETLLRIRKLVIPPAWKNVWICSDANGHLQATGIDKLGRKQYRYHQLWSLLRNQTKFSTLCDFGKSLSAIRARVEKDLALPGLPKQKVLALIVSLMEQTNIRIGTGIYEKLYGSFGLTTLKDDHVSLSGNSIVFSFRGKKGVSHKIKLQSKKFASLVKRCRDIPGKELFQFVDSDGTHQSVDSGMVNRYLHELSDREFTAKDFRTWSGTLHALRFLTNDEDAENATINKKLIQVFDQVAEKLGNTRAVCKKYYVHPLLIELYKDNKLKHFCEKNCITKEADFGFLSNDEIALLNILEVHSTKKTIQL